MQPQHKRMFNLAGNNRGLPCPFSPVVCQEGYCHQCQIYLDWQKREDAGFLGGKRATS